MPSHAFIMIESMLVGVMLAKGAMPSASGSRSKLRLNGIGVGEFRAAVAVWRVVVAVVVISPVIPKLSMATLMIRSISSIGINSPYIVVSIK